MNTTTQPIYETVIGLEIHAQLLTKTKIFCTCSTTFGAEVNTAICPVCTGLPGVLPVFNQKVLEYGVRAGLALNCKIAPRTIFARKNYFYPDLPKNYQISQYELPLALDGHLEFYVGETTKKVGIIRAHLEEDAGKLVHQGSASIQGATHSLVDFNRTGVPLLEIVSEPELRSPEEAKAYVMALRNLLITLGVCDGNMEEGSLRCDANISLRPQGSSELGTRTEIKNMNSFRAIERALASEIKRQQFLLEKGERIVQETRLYNDATGETFSMRSKEEAHDYRYFPEPDLVPIEPDPAWVETIRKSLPELPFAKEARYVEKLGLPREDAVQIVGNLDFVPFFEKTVSLSQEPKTVANWLLGEISAYLNEHKITLSASKLTPEKLVALLKLMKQGTISGKIAKTVLQEIMATGEDPETVVKEKGMTQIDDSTALGKIIQDVIEKNPQPVNDFKAGKAQSLGFLVGQVMKATQGRANPTLVQHLLTASLSQ